MPNADPRVVAHVPMDLTKGDGPETVLRGNLLDAEKEFQRANIEMELGREKALQAFHLSANVYRQGRDYSNFMIAAGYAAFIALWAGMAKDISPAARLLSGGLMGVSLVSFIAWEIARMIANAREGQWLSEAIWYATDKTDLADRIREAEDSIRIADLRMHDIWPIPFGISVMCGIVGGAVLSIAALAEFMGKIQ